MPKLINPLAELKNHFISPIKPPDGTVLKPNWVKYQGSEMETMFFELIFPTAAVWILCSKVNAVFRCYVEITRSIGFVQSGYGWVIV